LNGRNFEQLIFLAPGVLPMTNISRGLFYGTSNAYSVGGIRPNGQLEVLDDTDVMDYMNRGSGAGVLGTSMGVDAIAEFQTLTNTYGAQFGGAGAVVNEVSKSGTNALHGSAYEFLRNSALDSRNFFDPVKIPEYQRNQFGAAVGGPIKKDKMFFFVNYEGLRQRLGETQNGTIMDANARLGIINGASICPATANATCSNPVQVPGAATNGYVNANVLPYLLYYNSVAPPTTFVGSGTQAYSQTATQPGTENYILARYDWTIGQKDSIFARYLGDKANLTEPFAGTFTLWPAAEADHNQFVTVEEKHIFSATLINTFHLGFSRPLETLYTLKSVSSLPGTPSGFQYQGTAAGLPDGRILITGLTSPGLAGASLGPNRQGPIHFLENKSAVGDDILWSKGSHSVRFGGSITRIRGGTIQNSPGGGDVQFNSLTQFLQGNAYSVLGPLATLTLVNGPGGNGITNFPGTNGYRDFRETDFAMYIQDDWKVTPTLTLNIGLRYEPTTDPTCYSSINNASGFCSVIAPPPYGPGAQPCVPPGTATCSPLGTVVAAGFSPTHKVWANNPSLRAIDPRIGFAWDPFKDHKTSVRGGYGIFQQLIAMRDYEVQYDLTPPFSLATEYAPSFPNPPNSVTCAAADAKTPNSCAPTVQLGDDPYNAKTPYVQEWNLTLQREFAKTIFSAAYVGSHSIHQYVAIDENLPIPTVGVDGNLVYGSQVQPAGPGTNAVVLANTLLNPNFEFINQAQNVGWTKYNSLQLGAVRSLANNWQMQFAYTYSKCRDIESGAWGLDAGIVMQNGYNFNADQGWCGYDIRHNIYINSMYNLPFHGDRLIAGWALSGIFTYHTGVPMNITTGFADAYPNTSGAGSNRPNYTPNAPNCNGNPYNTTPTASPAGTTLAATGGVYWVNPNCFSATPIGEFGNTPRNFLHGPNFRDLDFSILKNTKITERFNVQFRAEFFNIMNNVNFGQPGGALFTPVLSKSGPTQGLINIVGATSTSPGLPQTSVSSSAGKVTVTSGTSRQIQFGVKLVF
jgi:hypothetical protein